MYTGRAVIRSGTKDIRKGINNTFGKGHIAGIQDSALHTYPDHRPEPSLCKVFSNCVPAAGIHRDRILERPKIRYPGISCRRCPPCSGPAVVHMRQGFPETECSLAGRGRSQYALNIKIIAPP